MEEKVVRLTPKTTLSHPTYTTTIYTDDDTGEYVILFDEDITGFLGMELIRGSDMSNLIVAYYQYCKNYDDDHVDFTPDF